MEEAFLRNRKSQQIKNIDISLVRVIDSYFYSQNDYINILNQNLVELSEQQIVDKANFGLNIYCFKLEYIDEIDKESKNRYGQVWKIHRRLQDFQNLERDLEGIKWSRQIPKESLELNPEKVLFTLKNYLQNEFRINRDGKKLQTLMNFIELSYLDYSGQIKFKECYLQKQAGGRHMESRCRRCGTFWRKWDNRYFTITSEAVMYSKGPDIENSIVREILSYDANFKIQFGQKKTGYQLGIIINTSTRKLIIRAPDIFVWADFLARLSEAYTQSPYTKLHKFTSIFPERFSQCKWYNSGEEYFSDLYIRLREAKEMVFITGLWVSPEFYLKRPVSQQGNKNKDSRLDLVLKYIADRGVKVYMIVYQEPTIALTTDSLHTKTYLESLSLNIHVHRHPIQGIPPSLWAHHEKIVVIDNTYGFMGGLDICFGRMDNPDHFIFDMHYENTRLNDEIIEYWPGIDYSNSRVKDFINVKETQNTLLQDKRSSPKMPWQDIAISITGGTVFDMSKHFIAYWNFVTMENSFAKRAEGEMLLKPKDYESQFTDNLHQDMHLSQTWKEKVLLFIGVQQTQQTNILTVNEEESEDDDDDLDQNNQITEIISKIEQSHDHHIDVTKSHNFEEEKKQQYNKFNLSIEMGDSDQFDRKDLKGQSYTNISNHINLKNKKRRMSQIVASDQVIDVNIGLDYLKMFKNITEISEKSQNKYIQIKDNPNNNTLEQTYNRNRRDRITHADQYREVPLVMQQSNELLNDLCYNRKQQSTNIFGFTCQTQLLRSASCWSIGCKNKEVSIQFAYIQLIAQAQNFIYIENQFFISNSAGSRIKNQIASALVERIKQAAEQKEKFKVIVFIPLLPGFEGEIDDPSSVSLKIQLHWEYATISRGGNSILEQLYQDPNIDDPFEYIEFYSLRQHSKDSLTNTPKTEIIYIHSKLMIIDDQIALIGSANINDRSLIGDRDSEMAIVVQDSEKLQVQYNGEITERAKFAHELRKNLYISHFGLKEAEVQDPLNNELLQTMRSRAKLNTLILREIFACYPDDTVLNFSDYESKNYDKYDEFSLQLKGQAVEFPLKFMEQENFEIKIYQKEYIVPEITFT